MRDPSIHYVNTDGALQPRSPYWASNFTSGFDAVSHASNIPFSKTLEEFCLSQITFFVADYPDAIGRAIALDERLHAAAMSVSAHYADLVSLATRQAMGGMELTVGRTSSDPTQWNTSDVKMFMKNLGTDG